MKLRQMFDGVVSEPVPDEFLDILRRADGAPPVKAGREPGGQGLMVRRVELDAAEEKIFKQDLVALIPHLRAFARTLCGDAAAADDLAQDAVMKAWDARSSFQMGTNMKAWTFMILRNQFYSEKRRSWRQSQLDQEAAERTLVAIDDPSSPIALDEMRLALGMLPAEQREALILVGAGGFAYEEAADICGCAVGTVKSRVSRARRAPARHPGGRRLRPRRDARRRRDALDPGRRGAVERRTSLTPMTTSRMTIRVRLAVALVAALTPGPRARRPPGAGRFPLRRRRAAQRVGAGRRAERDHRPRAGRRRPDPA